jgi:glycyl-tRNA synthetase
LNKDTVEELKNLKLELDSFNEKKFDEVIEKYSIKSPDGNVLSKSYPFNLMFGTEIGPSGKFKGYNSIKN